MLKIENVSFKYTGTKHEVLKKSIALLHTETLLL